MYIEDELYEWINKKCEKAGFGINEEGLSDIIENCGIWGSFEAMQYETEDFDMTLEECYRDYWYIVYNNKVFFTNPDTFADDLDEYLGL